jgi:exopolysaccharide biosynthesis operon protein EpsL
MRTRRFWTIFCAACWPAAGIGAFDPTDVVQIQANASLYHDNNLFRLPDRDTRLFGINPDHKADTALVKGVGLKFDKSVSRQRLIADLNLNETTYDNNTNLDFFGGEGRLAWLWRVGNYWDGEASFRKKRTLGGFTDFRQNVQDLIDTDTYAVAGGYQFHPRWRISAELREDESAHSAVVRQSLDSNAQTTAVTLTYRTPAANSIGLQARQTDRNYPNRVTAGLVTFGNGHKESRLNAIVAWQFSGALKLDFQGGHVDVAHDQLPARDFSGVTWRAAATWDPTAKLRLHLNSTKDIRLYEDLASSYIVVHSLGLSPIYAITSKITLQGDLNFEKRDYRGDPGFFIGANAREDDVQLARLAVTYSLLRNVDLSFSYEAGERKSNNALSDFQYQSWFGTARVRF